MSLRSSDHQLISNKGRVALTFLFNPPPLGPIPPRVNFPLMVRINSPPCPTMAALMRRSSAYYDAGCPLDLCETAAARDVWLAMYQLSEAPDPNP